MQLVGQYRDRTPAKDVADSRMKLIVENLSQKYENWARLTVGHIPRPLGSIQEISKDTDDKN